MTNGLAAIFFHRVCLISLVSAIAFLLGSREITCRA